MPCPFTNLAMILGDQEGGLAISWHQHRRRLLLAQEPQHADLSRAHRCHHYESRYQSRPLNSIPAHKNQW